MVHLLASPAFSTNAKSIPTHPDTSKHVRMYPNASEWVAAGPNTSKTFRKLPKTFRKLRNFCEKFAKISRKFRDRAVAGSKCCTEHHHLSYVHAVFPLTFCIKTPPYEVLASGMPLACFLSCPPHPPGASASRHEGSVTCHTWLFKG